MLKFFQNMPEVLAVISEREDGSMKLIESSDFNLENRRRFFERIGIGEKKAISAEIVHGTNVEIVDASSSEFISKADGLLTKDKNIFLSATVADCIPVYLFETDQKIPGVLHCGWRGIVGGIVENAIRKIAAVGGKTENLKVAMGPGINSCHFEIREDVLEKFRNYSEFVIRREGKLFVDLKGIIKKQLTELGIALENIENNNACTMEDDRFFSFRKDKPKVVEAMIAVVGVI